MFSLIVLVIAPPCETRAIIFTGPLIVTLFPVVVSGSIALLEAPPNSGSFTVKATVLGGATINPGSGGNATCTPTINPDMARVEVKGSLAGPWTHLND